MGDRGRIGDFFGAVGLAALLTLGAGRAVAQRPPVVPGTPRRVLLYGTVSAAASGEPIVGALVETPGEDLRTRSDSVGFYQLLVSAGVHGLRVSRLGYDGQSVEVAVVADSALRLDISLVPRPVPLPSVTVVATRPPAPGDTMPGDPSAWIGTRRFTAERVRDDPAFAAADPLQVLTTDPDAAASPEAPVVLHVRGGGADENQVLLDGVPLYSPLHAVGGLSAVSPDVVSSVTLHAGVAPARFGGAVSSIIAIRTPECPLDSFWMRGAAESYSVRATVASPLPLVRGDLLVSGRHSTPDLLAGGGSQISSALSFGDLFVKGRVRLGESSLEIFSLTSGDQVGFDAQASPDASADSPMRPALGRNRFGWATSTQALIWRAHRDGAGGLQARAWRSGFTATADWAAASGPVHLTSRLSSVGVGADLAWRFLGTAATAGFRAERLRTHYAVRRPASPSATDTLPPLLDLASVPFLVSVYVEDRWSIGRHWTIAAGLRTPFSSGRWGGLEPRLSLRFAPMPGLALLAGYARMSQAVQSLRNEESVLGTIAGIGLPVADGTGGGPAARSDQLTLAGVADLGAGTAVTLNWYARRLDRLLLVAPVTSQPFAQNGFARGGGRASGVTVAVEHTGGRLVGHAAYAFSVVSREAAGQRYRPAFASEHALAFAVGYHLWPSTLVRAAFWASTGRPTSVLAADLEWAPFSLLAGTGDVAGSPQRIVGSLNGARLPAYARLDVGIRRTWRSTLFGRSADVTFKLDLSNVLGRVNALGIVEPVGASKASAIPMLPRTLTIGLEWAY